MHTLQHPITYFEPNQASIQWRRYRGGGCPPDSRFVTHGAPVLCFRMAPLYSPQSGEYKGLCIIFKIIKTFYIGNSLRVTTTQQLISDSLTCFAADALDLTPLATEAPHRGAP